MERKTKAHIRYRVIMGFKTLLPPYCHKKYDPIGRASIVWAFEYIGGRDVPMGN